MADGTGRRQVGMDASPAGGASLVLGLSEAKRRKSTNRRARWRDVVDELNTELWPQVSPSFRLRPGDTVFTIGSCFSRNIEVNLAALGLKVPMLDFRLPPEEFDGSPNAAINRFHPPAFRQCLEWAAAIHDRGGEVTWADCAPLAFDLGEDRWFDMDLAPAAQVSKLRFIERRQHIYEILSSAFRADCLMMTPGMIEAWRDLETGLFTYGPPYDPRMLRASRWVLEVLSYQRCLDDILAAIDVVRARNPRVNVLITTSPVPLGTTFTGRDVTIANAHSKAVLRAVCDAAVLEREGVDYFPSYEMATLSNPELVWKTDRLHVSQGFIGKIVAHMLDHYIKGVDAASIDYQRARALLSDDDPIGAEAAARRALESKPDHVDAKLVLAMALLSQRRWGEAQGILKEAAISAPHRCDVRVQLARALAGRRKVDRAVAMLEATMARPAFSLSDFMAADSVLRRASTDEAVRLATRAIELFPRHQEAHARLVDALLRGDRKSEAITALRRVAALSHPPPELLLELARLLLETGEAEEAAAQVRAALAEDPKNKNALKLRAELRSLTDA